MITAFVLHRVADYDAWRVVYDDFGDAQKAGGVTHEEVWRSQDDPNLVFIRHDFGDRAAAEAFFTGTELKETMMQAGVDASTMQIHYVEQL